MTMPAGSRPALAVVPLPSPADLVAVALPAPAAPVVVAVPTPGGLSVEPARHGQLEHVPIAATGLTTLALATTGLTVTYEE